MDKLIRDGISTYEAMTQLTGFTMSAPGWHSILTGVESTKHGVYDNNLYFLRNHDYKTFLWYARNEHNMKTMYVSWLNDRMSNSILGENSVDKGPIELIDEAATQFLEEELLAEDYDITFVHLDMVDAEGGKTGFSPENQHYLDSIEVADSQIARIINTIDSRETR